MRILLRLFVTVLVAVATNYIVYWIVGALIFALLPQQLTFSIALATSQLAAIFAARYVWMQTALSRTGSSRFVVVGALVTGAIGFSAGFFGPMLLTPRANQGPLLGLFITGPLGLILGGVGGAVYGAIRRARTSAPPAGPPNNRWRGP